MYLIQPATSKHMPKILQLVRELAAFENLEHEIVFNDNEFETNVFKYANVLSIEYDRQIIGYAIYFYSFSTFLGKGGIYLEDLYIQQQHRGKGVGKDILSYLANICVQKGLGRLEWACLHENECGINFYENKIGAKNLSDVWRTYRVDGENLKNLAKNARK